MSDSSCSSKVTSSESNRLVIVGSTSGGTSSGTNSNSNVIQSNNRIVYHLKLLQSVISELVVLIEKCEHL